MPSPTTSTRVATTPLVVIQSKDYDWILPVVIVLALLVAVLFVLVLRIYAKQWRTYSKRTLYCCDHEQGREPNYFGSSYQPTGNEKRGHLNPERSFRTFSSVINNKHASTSFGSEMVELRIHNSNRYTNERSAIHCNLLKENEVNSQRIRTQSLSTSQRGEKTEAWSTSQFNSDPNNPGEDRNNRTSECKVTGHSFENNFEPNAETVGKERADFYISTDYDSRGVDNNAYWYSDTESLDEGQDQNKTDSRRLQNASDVEKFGKIQSCSHLVDQSENTHHAELFDRQMSVPVNAHEIDESSNLARPLGKFETVYNLATTGEFEDKTPHFQNLNYENDDEPYTSRSEGPITLKHQIPKIVLPKGGYIDFDDRRHEDNISYYNSSSLESCVSTSPGPCRRRIARANNPFDIEAANLPRTSSAPCLAPFEQDELSAGRTRPEVFISRSISAGHPLTADKETSSLLHSRRLNSGSSSSWSSEFFELVREAGITDSSTQRRMKKLIDDRYNLLFDKKYPEVQSLYSSVHPAEEDADYASEKRSFTKHRRFKARMARRKEPYIDSDGYDRLKLPQVIYSEVRPPSKKKSAQKERRNSEPDKTNQINQSVDMRNSSGLYRNRPLKNIELDFDKNASYPENVARRECSVDEDRENSAKTIYDAPWDLNVKRFGAFLPIQPRHVDNGPSTQSSEPQYESIASIRSKLSKNATQEHIISHKDKDKDKVIYDDIHNALAVKELASDSKDDKWASISRDTGPHIDTSTTQPTPPSSSPPKNPNVHSKNSPKSADDNTPSNQPPSTDYNNSHDEQNLQKVRQIYISGGSLSGASVTDFPPDPVWRSPSSADIKIEPFDSEAFRREKFERSTSFIASSCDTPLEHPSSDDDEDHTPDSSEGGGRRQSFYKDVMYTYQDEEGASGKDESGNEDEGNGDGSSDSRPFQKRKLSMDYTEPVQISRV